MNEPKRRAARHSLTGTGLYIALFLGLTALAVAGYWMLLPSSADKTPTNVTEPPVTTPITAEPVTPDVPEVKPEEPAEPVQSVVEVTVSEKEPEVTEPVTPVAPRLIVSPLSGETVAAFSMDELAYSETLADWRTHDGIDIKADAGTQVLAASSGTVLSVADDDLMGTTVVIAHDGGYETTYSNLQSVPTVAPEQYVSAGQVIGAVGTTSLAEASMSPHLHFSVSKDGKVIDTSMGFTPLEGIIMGSRCGSIDPAIVPFIMEKENIPASEMGNFMNKQCGLLGVSEVSSDLRDVMAAVRAGNKQAQLAFDILCYGIKKYIGSYAAAMNGLDCVVFTAGIGENTPEVRAGALAEMDYLGIRIDPEKNANVKKLPAPCDISADGSRVRVYVIPTNEELVIASDTEKLVSAL